MFALDFLRNLGPPRRCVMDLGLVMIVFGGVGAGLVFFVGVGVSVDLDALGVMTTPSLGPRAADGIFSRCVVTLLTALSV